MARQKRYIVDGRPKLENGDRVKIKAIGRRGIWILSRVHIKPSEVFTVSKLNFDIYENRFFAVVTGLAGEFWMPISDLVFFDREN